MASPSYDPIVIRKFAKALYSRARSIILVWTFIGAAIGGGGGYFLGSGWVLSGSNVDAELVFAAVGLALLGGVGFVFGSARAFMLKLQAQIALCQVQIEENTRK